MIDKSNYINENKILSIIKQALDNMLALANIDWQVVVNNQPTIQAMQNNTVYFDVISKRRIGTQGVNSKKVNGSWVNTTSWVEDVLVRISAFRQRLPETDTELTLTSNDVIGYIQGCINSNYDTGDTTLRGVRTWFNNLRIEVVKSTDIRIIDYETDSGLKEYFPQFDFTLLVHQEITDDSVGDVEKIIGNIERV